MSSTICAAMHLTKYRSCPLKFMDTHPSGDTVSRVIADVDTFADGLLMGFTQLFYGCTDNSRYGRSDVQH